MSSGRRHCPPRAAVAAAALALAFGPPGLRPAAAELDPRSYPGLPVELSEEEWGRLAAGEVVARLEAAEGSAVKRGVALAILAVPAERLFRVVTDNARFAEFMPHVAESSVEEAEDGSIVNFQRLALPLVSDRHYKVRVVNGAEEVDGFRVWRSAWTYVPGSGNIVDSQGSWSLVGLGEGRTLLIYLVLTDPGGLIPKWLHNRATRRTLPELVASVHQRALDPRYD